MKKLTILLLITTFSLSAAPVRFDFVFEDPDTFARTTGFIVFEESLLSNPVNENIYFPDDAVLDLQLTVTGSAFSDGDYDMYDYERVEFWSNGGTFDFSQPLIGQATDDDPWGTTLNGNAGAFTIMAQGSPSIAAESPNPNKGILIPISGAPSACGPFSLCEGYGEIPNGTEHTKGQPGLLAEMDLLSMNRAAPRAAAQSVPSLSTWASLTLGLMFLVMAGLFRRRLN